MFLPFIMVSLPKLPVMPSPSITQFIFPVGWVQAVLSYSSLAFSYFSYSLISLLFKYLHTYGSKFAFLLWWYRGNFPGCMGACSVCMFPNSPAGSPNISSPCIQSLETFCTKWSTPSSTHLRGCLHALPFLPPHLSSLYSLHYWLSTLPVKSHLTSLSPRGETLFPNSRQFRHNNK